MPIILVVICSCNNNFEVPEIDRKSDHMILDFAKTVSNKDLYPMGIGGGLDHSVGKINRLSITFSTQSKISNLNQARELLVETLDSFMRFINDRGDMREDLAVFPFTIDHVRVSIVYLDAHSGDIVNIANCFSQLYYCTENRDPTGPWVDLHKETYDEAKAILEKQREDEI